MESKRLNFVEVKVPRIIFMKVVYKHKYEWMLFEVIKAV